MPNELLVNIAVAVVGLIFGHLSGVWQERRKQSLLTRVELLKPIEEWVNTANRLVRIVADDMVTLGQGLPLPVNYSLQDRAKVGREIAETTPKVVAILDSKSLRTLGTWGLSNKLSKTIREINAYLQGVLIPIDNDLLNKRDKAPELSEALIAASLPWMKAGVMIQQAYELIAKLKVRMV